MSSSSSDGRVPDVQRRLSRRSILFNGVSVVVPVAVYGLNQPPAQAVCTEPRTADDQEEAAEVSEAFTMLATLVNDGTVIESKLLRAWNQLGRLSGRRWKFSDERFSVIEPFLSHIDARSRASAVRALAWSHDQGAMSVIFMMLYDSSPSVKRSAAGAILDHGGEAGRWSLAAWRRQMNGLSRREPQRPEYLISKELDQFLDREIQTDGG